MIVVLRSRASEEEIADVCRRIEAMGYRAHTIRGELRTVVGAIGDDRAKDRLRALESLECVESVAPILQPFKLASREMRAEPTRVVVDDVVVGGPRVVVMAGPCSVESREQLLEVAHKVKGVGATVLRGGAFKPRTSPYAFQGLGQEGLRLLAEAKAETGLPIVTELMDVRDLEAVLEVADVIQIGARNMQNYSLLAEIGRAGRPVLLKRGLSAPLDELLLAAEYILKEGNPAVMLCERGIRTFETDHRRVTLDLMAVPILKELSHLPVIVDPSHAAGRRELVLPLSLVRPMLLSQTEPYDLSTDCIPPCAPFLSEPWPGY